VPILCRCRTDVHKTSWQIAVALQHPVGDDVCAGRNAVAADGLPK
jgi:hypothetical protein